MLEYIKGILTEATPSQATIEINGLGYLIFIPLSTYTRLPQIGCSLLLYTSVIIREDSHKIFGFFQKNERNLFEKYNTINGVGPKTSLALVGHLDIADLEMAISSANIALLCKVPGIGKKTAERIVLELKGHIFEPKAPDAPSLGLQNDSLVTDAISALVNLGYQPLDSQKAVKKAFDNITDTKNLAALITAALKKI